MKAALIYIRTSTEEQNPANQIEPCQQLMTKLGITDYDILEDKITGWKEIERESFDNIKVGIEQNKIKTIVVWDLDRLYRNRKRLIAFFELCKIKKCRIYSFRQDWLENINNMPQPFDEIIHSLMLQIMGWLAEEESSKKSQRVKLAVRRNGKETLSYKGNKWGRKNLSKQATDKIIELHKQGKSIRTISKEVTWGNGKNVATGSVHKVLAEFKLNKQTIA